MGIATGIFFALVLAGGGHLWWRRSPRACSLSGRHRWGEDWELRGHPAYGGRPHPVHGGRAVKVYRCQRCPEWTYSNPAVPQSVEDWT